MRSPAIRNLAFLLTLSLASPLTLGLAYGQEAAAAESAETIGAKAANASVSAEEMEVLVARIALYPDDLVAAIVSASLYPLQIVEAERFLANKEKKKDLQPSKSWDGCVISLLNKPEIVKMMSDDLEWTQALGEAAVNQQEDLLRGHPAAAREGRGDGRAQGDDKVVVEQAVGRR